MIINDFEYYRPSTLMEAADAFTNLDSQNKNPVYYAGGTEILSMSKMNQFKTGAVIDIKDIPDCNIYNTIGSEIVIGSAVTLTKVCEGNIFPLLTLAAKSTADHTSRNKITLGGNVCGKIVYREAVLPFLLCDSTALLHGPGGSRRVALSSAFNKTLNLQRGEFLVQLITDKSYINLPHVYIKKTKGNSVDYPLLSVSLIKRDNMIRAAFSGVLAYPFRSDAVEKILNDNSVDVNARLESILKKLPDNVINNLQASAGYREFVLKNTINDALNMIGGMQ